MNYFEFYKNSKRRLTDSLVSIWASGHTKEQECLRELLDEREPLIADPVFQTIFPWDAAKATFEEHARNLHMLDEDFVKALSSISGDAEEYCFPADRYPYKHQSESWKGMLVDRKTIAVTSGTGSGKTECFIIPVLQDLYRERCKPDYREGVQAIFLYPLNALMKNQRERIHQWSKSLPKPVTYAIYNGEMEESGKTSGEYPQVCTRKEMREHPPQILFTNPTMLNYMMVRSSDQSLLEKSKGRLRWILLDEAHTYSGSSATELALQLRRVIDAFGVTVDDVNFAVTSATMGDKDATSKLIGIVSQLTGKDPSNILVINGQRIIPELDKGKLQQSIDELNKKHGCRLTPESINALRKNLNEKSALSAKEIADAAGLATEDRGTWLSLIDDLSSEIPGLSTKGKPLALLPTRAHFFIRAINGVFSCVNSKCPSKSAKSLKIGSLTTYQSALCPHCGKNMVEVANCADCGELLVVGENNVKEGYRLKTNEISLDENPFDIDVEDLEGDSDDSELSHEKGWDMFIYGSPQKDNPRKIDPQFFEFDVNKQKIIPSSKNRVDESSCLVFQAVRDVNSGLDLCPCCGVPVRNKLLYLRASANLLGRFLASTVLDNASPMGQNALSKDKDILYEGKKYITFTDSRQGTAKSAMGINHDVEINWIRSAIFHHLAKRRQEKSVPQGLSAEEREDYEDYLSRIDSLTARQRRDFEELKAKLSGSCSPSSDPFSWSELRSLFESYADLKHLYKHLKNAKLNEVSSKDGSGAEKEAYLDALFLDQFGWISRSNNTLENLGLVRMVYPSLAHTKLPEDLGPDCIDKGITPFTDEDWQNFLKICVDYFVRGGKHYIIPTPSIGFLVQNAHAKDLYDVIESKFENGRKWPQLSPDGKLSSRQPKLILLLMAALGINDVSELNNEKRTLINTLLLKAWRSIRDLLLIETDSDRKGYRINLLDRDKIKIQIIEKGWRCPVDNVVVDTLFRGFSPHMRGYATRENFNRFKVDSKPMDFPYFPYAEGKEKSAGGGLSPVSKEYVYKWIDENWRIQKNNGIVSDLHFLIMSPPKSIFMAGEHSAQQQTAVLENYEKEFNQGHLNVLSCSTTMEMGVDLKGISAVVMNSVPPKPANYQQRAGRAGRRGETKALTLTFCTPNPVGINAWRNPMWPLKHKTEIPDVKLTSPQIIQRHVNAFLFETFIQNEGGMGVKDHVSDFFAEGHSGYTLFCDFLQSLPTSHVVFDELDKHHKMLVAGSCLGNQSLLESIDKCLIQLSTVYEIYKNRLVALLASREAAEEGTQAARTAIDGRIKNFKDSFLLGYLAEHNFLPSAGIPTGLVEFNNACSENSAKRNGGRRKKMPTQHLSQAISMYAPGKQVVINEWCYQSSGIAMKSKFDEAKRYIIQNCQKCGYSQIVYGSPLTKCPKCQSTSMAGLKGTNGDEIAKFTEIVEPAGFSVDWLGGVRPTRTIRNDNTMSLAQPLLLQMEPWPEKKTGAKVALRSSTEESEILFYNSGTHQTGFMLCPYCGRMESETDDAAKKRFISHKHLETGAVCEGADHDGARIRHNVLLVGRYQTDFVEVKFYDENNHEIHDVSTLYSLGVIISRKLAEFLGVNEGEIDFGYSKQYHSIFIFDTALGGAGYSPLLRDYKNEVFNLARNALREKCCSKACTHCLVDRSSQWYLNYLDRQKAYDWLEMEFSRRNVPDEVGSAFGDAETITTDWATEFYRVCRDSSVKSLKLFVDDDLSKWDYDSFMFKHQIDQLRARMVDCSFVSPKKLNVNGLSRFEITPLLGLLYSSKFEYGKIKLDGLKPILAVTHNDGRKRIYFGKDVLTTLDGDWGAGVVFSSNYEGTLDFTQIKVENLLAKLNSSEEGMFDLKIKDYNSSVATMFDVMRCYRQDKWNDARDVFAEDKDVEITYADKYLNTPLGCIILSNLVASVAKAWNLNISKLKLNLAMIKGSNVYGYNDFESDFTLASRRNEFLKKCFSQIVGIVPDVEMVNNLHPRYLQIKGKEYTCEIRPDAGVAWGWSLDRLHANLRLEQFEDNVTQDLKLFNKRRNDGILYTVAWQKHTP